MLKGIVFFSTLGFFTYAIYMGQEQGFQPPLIGLIAYFVVTFWFTLGAETEEKSYLGLILERLKLEQQAKIDKLKSDAK